MTSSTNCLYQRCWPLTGTWKTEAHYKSHQCLDGSQQSVIYLKHFPHTTLTASSPYFLLCLQFLTASSDIQPVMNSFLNVNLTVQDKPHATLQWYPEEMTANLTLALKVEQPWQLWPCLSKINAGLKLKNLHRFLLKDRNATKGNLKGFMILIFNQTLFQHLKSLIWVIELVE